MESARSILVLAISRRAAVRAAHSLFLAVVGVLAAFGAPTPHPGWPVNYSTPGAGSLGNAMVQFADMDGDGAKELILVWFAYRNPDYPGSIVAYRGDGSIVFRIDYERIHFAPALMDRDSDGRQEIIAGRGKGIAMFDSLGNLLWNHTRIDGDPTWGMLTQVRPSIADLDGTGEPAIAAVAANAFYAFYSDGGLRPGFPTGLWIGNFWSPPAVIDVTGDGKDDLLAGDANGKISCYEPDGTACPGWPYRYQPGGSTSHSFDLSPPTVYRTPTSSFRIVAENGPDTQPQAIHVIDPLGLAVPPYPRTLGGTGYGDSDAMFEVSGQHFLAIGGTTSDYVFNLETASVAPGWPRTSPKDTRSHAAIADLGQSGPVGLLFGGVSTWDGKLEGRNFSGALLSGYPRTLPDLWELDTIAIGTFDNVETTVCWTVGSYSGDTGTVDCFDLGVPWDRGKVQWGNYGFDLQHTSFFRRLWQIDRSRTCLLPQFTEIPALGKSFEVRVCPRDLNDANLGIDQQIRFARRPIVGKFVGKVQYDAATGDYWRMYETPVLEDGVDVEFRVFVNEELDDTMPMVRLRGRPKITSIVPRGIPRGVMTPTPVDVGGIDFSPAPILRSLDAELVVDSYLLGAPNAINASLHALASAPVGWARIEVVSQEGRVSNPGVVFVYEPGEVTLIAEKPDASLEWFAAAPGSWTLERSDEPTFAAPTTLYFGAGQTFSDPTPTPVSGTWYYRVR